MIELNKIKNRECLQGLKALPDNCIDCCVTSPPYFGLRDYGTNEQIGLEKTPELFVKKLVEVFTEVKRVLKPQGTLWLNLGDSYAAAMKQRTIEQAQSKSTLQGRKNGDCLSQINKITSGLKPKDLIGIPWMVAFALRNEGCTDMNAVQLIERIKGELILKYEGESLPDKVIQVLEKLDEEYRRAKGNSWYLRQDIIWSKPNPMPESVTDRCTKSHEYIFLLSKSERYYYNSDAIRTPVKDSTVQRMMQQIENQKGSNRVPGKTNGTMKAVGPGRVPRNGVDTRGGNQASVTGIKAYSHRGTGDKKLTGHSGNFDYEGNLIGNGMANKKVFGP